MADKGIIKMNINELSKYIILFLFTVLIVLTVLLSIYAAQNKQLMQENTRLTEMVELRDAAITEIDKNIAALQQQVLEAESICNERLKARENLLTFLSIEPAYDVGKNGVFFPQTPSFNINTLGSKAGAENRTAPVQPRVISYEKSNIAINYINDYWSMFTAQSSDSKK